MPFVSDNNLNEEEQNNSSGQTPGQVSGQPQTVSGSTNTQNQIQNTNSAASAPQAPTLASGAGFAGAGSGQGQSKPSYNSSAPTSSGQWTNLQNYLNANNGGGFGNQFAGNVSKDTTQAQNDLQTAGTNFQNAVQSGTISDNADIDNKATNAPESLSSDEQKAFQKELQGAYSGPQSASADPGFINAQAEAKNAYTESQLANTQSGQNVLLQKYFNTPTYTSGEKNLDSAILSSDPDAQSALKSLATTGSELPVSAQQAFNAANSTASQGQATTAQAATSALSALNSGLTSRDTAVRNSLSDYLKSQNPEYQAELSAIQNGQIPDYLYSQLGAPGDSYQSYGINPTQFLTHAAAPTLETVVSPEQAAQISALESLGTGHISDPTQYDYANSSTAGSYNPNRNAVLDVPGITAAVSQGQAHYNNAISTAAQQHQGAIAPIQAQIDRINQASAHTPTPLPADESGLLALQNQLAAQNASYNNTLATIANQYGLNRPYSRGQA